MKAEMEPRIQKSKQPVFQGLIALLGLRRFECRPDHLVRAVPHTPYHIGVGLSFESGCVAERRKIFADVFRIAVTFLELDRTGLAGVAYATR